MIDLDEAAKLVQTRCNGDHSLYCSWHAVMSVLENWELSQVENPNSEWCKGDMPLQDVIEQAVCLLDGYCQRDNCRIIFSLKALTSEEIQEELEEAYKYEMMSFRTPVNCADRGKCIDKHHWGHVPGMLCYFGALITAERMTNALARDEKVPEPTQLKVKVTLSSTQWFQFECLSHHYSGRLIQEMNKYPETSHIKVEIGL